MNCSRLAIAIAVTSALSAANVFAQTGVRQPLTAQSSYEYGNYYAQDETPASPSDREAAPEAAPGVAPLAACNSCGGCDTCCNSCCRRGLPDLNCCEGDQWQLFECFNENNCHGVTVNGWLNAGISFNDYGTPYNGTVTFDDRDSELMMNQAYVYAEKVADTGGCGWDFGGRMDVLYGTDSRFTEARGLETHQDLSPKWNNEPFYGVALPQLYAEVAYNDLSVKLGHFYTIIGYESVMAPANFFYSHAYTMQYGEPFTHTGALATYKYSDTTNILFGFDRGWDNWEGSNSNRLGALGGFTWDGGEGLTVALTGVAGQNPTQTGVDNNRYLYSLVVSKQFNTRLTYVFQHDNGFQQAAFANGQNAEWYGINQYLFYKLNCCWTAGVRAEWFRDDDGFRVSGIGDRRNGHPVGGASFPGNFYELSAGLNWSPNANLIVRPEVRFDWYDGTPNTPGVVGPFNDGNATDQSMFAVDAILKY